MLGCVSIDAFFEPCGCGAVRHFFQVSVSIDAVSRTDRAACVAELHVELFFSSNHDVQGATVAKVFTINEEFMYFSCNRANLPICLNTFKMHFDVI